MNKMFTLLLLVSTFSLLGCNKSDKAITNDEVAEDDGSLNTIVDAADREIHFKKVPEHIIPLGNGELDIIYELGHEAVGRPNGDPLIKEAEELEEIGSSHSIDLEKITALDADVVLGNFPMNMKDIETIESLDQELVLSSANSVKEITEQIDLYGQMLDETKKASELIANINEQVSGHQDTRKEPIRSLLIYGAPGTNMAALPHSLSGDILDIVGGENIASDFEQIDDYPQYAQLNAERIIEANPEVILLMSHGNPEEVKAGFLKEMEQNAGWSNLVAIKNDQFIILPPDLFGTNPGTRIIDAMNHLSAVFADIDS